MTLYLAVALELKMDKLWFWQRANYDDWITGSKYPQSYTFFGNFLVCSVFSSKLIQGKTRADLITESFKVNLRMLGLKGEPYGPICSDHMGHHMIWATVAQCTEEITAFPFMETVFPDICGLFHHGNAPATKQEWSRNALVSTTILRR